MKKLIWSRILLGIGITILVCYVSGLTYFYNFCEYSPYASVSADVDAFIHSLIYLPPMIACFLSYLFLRICLKKSEK